MEFKIKTKDLKSLLRRAGIENKGELSQWQKAWGEIQEEFMRNLKFKNTTESNMETWEDPGGDPPFQPSYDYLDISGEVTFTSQISFNSFVEKLYNLENHFNTGDEQQVIDFLKMMFNENVYAFCTKFGPNQIGDWIEDLAGEDINGWKIEKLDFSIKNGMILIKGSFSFTNE